MKTLKLAQDFLENVEKRDDKVNVSITQGLRGKLRQRFYRIENSFNVQVKKLKYKYLDKNHQLWETARKEGTLPSSWSLNDILSVEVILVLCFNEYPYLGFFWAKLYWSRWFSSEMRLFKMSQVTCFIVFAVRQSALRREAESYCWEGGEHSQTASRHSLQRRARVRSTKDFRKVSCLPARILEFALQIYLVFREMKLDLSDLSKRISCLIEMFNVLIWLSSKGI